MRPRPDFNRIANTVLTSGHFLEKQITVGLPGYPNVIEHLVTFHVPTPSNYLSGAIYEKDYFKNAVFEESTGYVLKEFSGELDQRHSEKVAEIALSLFDQTEPLHGLGKRERIYLEAAALLHDVGYFISMQKHHKHSHYIIANSEIVGLSPAERLIVAGISRYHRKATPDAAAHPEYEELPKKDRAVVWSLAAILRIADALDKEHNSAIRGIGCRLQNGSLFLRAVSRKSCRLEALGVTANAAMFRDHFGVDVQLTIDREE